MVIGHRDFKKNTDSKFIILNCIWCNNKLNYANYL